jgi:hypothetical protein
MDTEETLHEISCEIGVIRYELYNICPRRPNPARDAMETRTWEVGGRETEKPEERTWRQAFRAPEALRTEIHHRL